MPPSKKKGVNRLTGNAELQLGDLVLAKVKGFPPWPAKICRPEDWDKSPDPRKYFVEFFGTAEIAFVAPADIQIFTNESRSKLATRCQGKTVKYFAQAVKEICEAFEKLQKSLDESGEGVFETEVGTLSALTIGVEGRRHLDSNEMDQPKQVFQKSVNDKPFGSIDELHLEPCTHSRGTMANESSELNDIACESESPILSFKRSKPSVNNKKKAKEAKVTLAELASDRDISKEEASHHLDVVHKNVAETCPPNNIVEASLKHYTHDKQLEIPSSRLLAKDGQLRLEGNSQATACEISVQKGEADDDKLQMGQEITKKLPNGSRLASVCADSSLDDEKLKVHVGSRKEYINLKKSKKELSKSDVKHNGPLNEKPVTSEGKTLGKASIKTGEKDLISNSKRKLATREEMPLSKKSKSGEKGVYVGKSSTKGQSIQFTSKSKNKKSFKNEKMGNLKVDENSASMSEAHGDKNHALPEKPYKGSDDPLSLSVTIEDPIKKAYKRLDDGLTTSVSGGLLTKKSNNGSNRISSKHGKPLVTHHLPKRRAVRYVDEDDDSFEECKTPVHRDTTASYSREHLSGPSSVTKSLIIKQDSLIESSRSLTSLNADKVVRTESSSMKETKNDCTGSPYEIEFRSSAHSPCNIEEKKQENSTNLLAGQNTVKQADSPDAIAGSKSLETLVSPGNADKMVNDKDCKSLFRKGATSVDVTQIHSLSKTSLTKQCSHSLLNLQKNKSSLEKSKIKSSIQLTVVSDNRSGVFSPACTVDNDFLTGQRPDIMESNSTDFLSESKTDSATSMRHLIAAAQAKRRQAYSQHLHNGSSTPGSAHTPHSIHGRSPSHISSIQTFSSDLVQKDKKLFQFSATDGSPPASQLFVPAILEDHEDCDNRSSTGHPQPGISPSGGTDAAVARDALEGMIETLSRTRDSIGRASRLAIDCAKYGIANEVVELLIRKLEGEPSLHRRIDLFFLVDSITQCSHTQKGIAGASYIPSVQAALPRLLGAAAPSGASARENRRQCLKVLRLWMERKILPESLLRRCMEQIEVPCEDLSSGISLRRPSRAERSVDDPIREMEGILVDEYGSNTTFQFPGLMSAQVLEDDEDCTCSPFNSTTVNSPKEDLSGLSGHLHPDDQPVVKHHHILGHVEKEMEMEEVPTICKDENLIDGNVPLSHAHPDGECNVSDEHIHNNQNVLPHLPSGSPPLPLDPPPLPPPLPPSPPPLLPPLPSSSPPQPPPPPPISPQPPPPPPPPPSSPPLAPQLRILPETSVIQPPLPPSSCQYRNHPSSSQEYCRPEIDNQLFQANNKSSIKDPSDYGVKADVVMQQSPNFVSLGIGYNQSMSGASSGQYDVGQPGIYIAPQVSHSNQIFQQSIASTQHRPLHSNPPQAIPSSQAPLNHPSYGTPMTQQQLQQHYHPYTSSLSHGQQQRYSAEEPNRLYPGDANSDNPGAWMAGGRTTSCLSAPFRQDGYLRPNVEMTSRLIVHHPQHNSAPSGTSLPGHGFAQMMSRADFSAVNFWRPA